MSKTMEYKGYYGSMELSIEDKCLFGKLLFMTDMISYGADTVSGLKAAFEDSVDDYIQTCAEIGKEPQKPFKGSFNIRITPELHKQAAVTAQLENISLNELVARSIGNYVNKTDVRPINIEHHDHHHYHKEEMKGEVPFGIIGAKTWKVDQIQRLPH